MLTSTCNQFLSSDLPSSSSSLIFLLIINVRTDEEVEGVEGSVNGTGDHLRVVELRELRRHFHALLEGIHVETQSEVPLVEHIVTHRATCIQPERLKSISRFTLERFSPSSMSF